MYISHINKGVVSRNVITAFIALVWLVNGLFCKLLNFVPRHQMIVARILGEEYPAMTTKIIGALEVLMAVWILSKVKSKWCALTQILVIAIMNCIEFIMAPDLLLFGKINIVIAALFIGLIMWNEFVPNNSDSK